MTDKQQESLAFRAATVKDVRAIVILVQSAYRGEASRAGWTTEADLLDGQRTDAEEVVALIRSPDSRILLAEQAGELLASVHLEKRGAKCHFGMFAVQPPRQRAGLGKAVLAEAERMVRDEWACRAMHMTVITLRTELIAWYERRGYQRTGAVIPFPYGDVHFGIPKRDDLQLEILRKPLV